MQKRLLIRLGSITLLGLLLALFWWQRQQALEQTIAQLHDSTWVQASGDETSLYAEFIFQLLFHEDGRWEGQLSRYSDLVMGIPRYDSEWASGRYQLLSPNQLRFTFDDDVCPGNTHCSFLQIDDGIYQLVKGEQRENRFRTEPLLAESLCFVPLNHWEEKEETLAVLCFDPLGQPIPVAE